MSGSDGRGLFARLRAWLGSLFGGRTDEASAATPADSPVAEPTPATDVCAVCGTDVADPTDGCPLCGSSDVRDRDARGENDDAGDRAPSPTATATDSTVDSEASRLSDLRDESGDEDATPTDAGGS
ncbi:MAG: hypothetical protein ABEJ43_08595 [Haloferacaceae archaeon]